MSDSALCEAPRLSHHTAKMKILLIICIALFAGCANYTLPQTTVNRALGRHQLPFQPNERFILQSVIEEPRIGAETLITITYFLDEKRRQWRLDGEGTCDGYVTDLGQFFDNEIAGVESSVMEERIIRLPTGEEITVSGNTIDSGGVRLRAIKSSESSLIHSER